MSRHEPDLGREDVEAGEDLQRRVRGLDPFIPTAPPLSQTALLAARADRVPRSSANVRLPAGLAAVAVSAAAIVAMALGMAGGPHAADTTESTAASGSAPASAPASGRVSPPETSPTPTASVAIAPSPSPATASPVPSPLPVFFHGAVMSARWSPDSSKVAIITGPGGATFVVHVLSIGGAVLDEFEASDFAWTGPDSYVALAAGAFSGQVGSPAHHAIAGKFLWLLAGPSGQVAAALDEKNANQYRVWTANGFGPVRDGVPIAFSPDGSMLAVVHWPGSCCAGGAPDATKAPGPPTLDVTRVSDGRSLAKNDNVIYAYSAYLAFSPNGKYIAFEEYGSTGLDDGVGVIEIATKKLWILAPSKGSENIIGLGIWADDDHLILDGGPLAPLPAGLPVEASVEPNADQMFRSANGRMATVDTDAPALSITKDGATATVNLPSAAAGVFWSPDGTMLLVPTGSDTTVSPYTYDLLLLRP